MDEQRKNGIIGKKVLVIFEDGANFHVSRKEGFCTENDSTEITLNNTHIIPKNRIIRIEVVG